MQINMKQLKDKIAVVTGASKGIGAAIARALADQGASIVVNYATSASDAEKVVDAITQTGGRAVAIQASVASEADVLRLFSETKRPSAVSISSSTTPESTASRPSNNSPPTNITVSSAPTSLACCSPLARPSSSSTPLVEASST